MTTSRHQVIPQPFNPVRSFTALACGLERITIKPEYAMHFDLIGAITTARKTYEAGVSVRGAIAGGGETDGLVADLHARFKEQATAMGYLVELVDDDAARNAVEGVDGPEMREAAE